MPGQHTKPTGTGKPKSPGQISRDRRKAGKKSAANQQNSPIQQNYRRYTPYIDGHNQQ